MFFAKRLKQQNLKKLVFFVLMKCKTLRFLRVFKFCYVLTRPDRKRSHRPGTSFLRGNHHESSGWMLVLGPGERAHHQTKP